MIPLRITLGLLLLVMCVLLAVGCIGKSGNNNNAVLTPTINTSTVSEPLQHPTLSPADDGKTKPAAIAPIQDYKTNKAEWQRKTANQILQIVDPYYPKMGNTPDEVKMMMHDDFETLLYSEEAIKNFGIQNTSSQPVGDHVNVFIYVNSSVSTYNVEKLMTMVEGRYQDYYSKDYQLIGWVDLNNIKTIASLKNVNRIEVAARLRPD